MKLELVLESLTISKIIGVVCTIYKHIIFSKPNALLELTLIYVLTTQLSSNNIYFSCVFPLMCDVHKLNDNMSSSAFLFDYFLWIYQIEIINNLVEEANVTT